MSGQRTAPGSGSLFDVCALEEQDRAVLEREVDRLRETLQKIGECAASHSGSDGQDVLLAALYLIAEKCEAVLATRHGIEYVERERNWPHQWLGRCRCGCAIRANSKADVYRFFKEQGCVT